ncbi:hypothetical protein H2202_000841 [Exophiala xenobiotica]|nr:hypothetical protein H2202_000841 [Exophiala xenobiotica]KAK5195300.1 hypothetical protein LTR92_005430 [Exophiala xenobiotica]KAK5209879.1 hypothetical protein LTR41_004511 [Exophiala xenobiotica]KAK5225754.1 hypothetical protein LTR72_003657 [Exophiala xenobiotica]KAK5236045.1 hypothetical protein LTR47_002771 [Exophiala xenobiotica]
MAKLEIEALQPQSGSNPSSTTTEGFSQRIKVLVTGGLGFVGSAIVRALQEQHPEWVVCILDTAEDPRGLPEYQDDDFGLLRGCSYEYVQADITDQLDVRKAFERTKPDAVVHSAGMVPPLSERYSRRIEALITKTNVSGTQHVVGAAKQTGCRALVYTSSCCAVVDDMSMSYPNIDERWPVAAKSSIYGESKVEAERIVIAANTTREQTEESAVDNPSEQSLHPRPQRSILTCVLRPSVIFGEGDKQLIPSIHACIAKGESRFVIGDGCNLWDTTYVGNVADAHVLALENLFDIRARRTTADAYEIDAVGSARLGAESAAGETFFIQNNEPISFREFSLAVWKEFGHYPPSLEIRIPEGLGWALGLVAELFTRISGRPLTLSRGSVMDAAAMRYATGDKASRIIGYRPRIGLEVGIRRSCQVSEVFFAGF